MYCVIQCITYTGVTTLLIYKGERHNTSVLGIVWVALLFKLVLQHVYFTYGNQYRCMCVLFSTLSLTVPDNTLIGFASLSCWLRITRMVRSSLQVSVKCRTSPIEKDQHQYMFWLAKSSHLQITTGTH